MSKIGTEQEIVSSQKSPDVWLKTPTIKGLGNYTSMFLDDFCCFSVFEDRGQYSPLFEINDKHLQDLLCFSDPSFLRYGFVQQLDEVAKELLLFGKTYVEVITEEDKDSKLISISFKPIYTNKARAIHNRVYFRAKKFDESMISFWVPKSNLLIFDLKELGFSRRYFVRLLRKIQKLELPFDMIGTSDFNIDYFKSYSEKKMLKLNRRTYWTGRNYTNQFISEGYLLYRSIKFKELQWRFLEYLISGYNKALSGIIAEKKVNGQIMIKEKKPDYTSYINRLQRGDLNFEQLSSLIYKY
jgi:hypothetical protein